MHKVNLNQEKALLNSVVLNDIPAGTYEAFWSGSKLEIIKPGYVNFLGLTPPGEDDIFGAVHTNIEVFGFTFPEVLITEEKELYITK